MSMIKRERREERAEGRGKREWVEQRVGETEESRGEERARSEGSS